MMKYTAILLLAFLLSGCDYFYNNIEFKGTTPGIDNGMVLIQDPSGKSVYGATIKAGKFSIRKQVLAKTGYYKLSINKSQTGAKPGEPADEFEIYLEPGGYTITTGRKGKSNYPIITSSSKIQNELSAYYPYADSIKHSARGDSAGLMDQLNSPEASKMASSEYMALVERVKAAQTKEGQVTATILSGFIAKYPQNEIAAHIMINTDYDSDPLANYKIYQKFSDAAKNSEDGQEIGDKLSHLVKMMPGALAPQLVGLTPDGKTIDIKAMHKKIILVEFWRAGIQVCRKHHQELIKNMIPNLSARMGIVSVSLDEKRDWWTGAIKDDNMNWPQVSDLKGFDSANVENWGISDVPTYCLLDGTGHIIDRNVEFDNIVFNVNNYFEKHP